MQINASGLQDFGGWILFEQRSISGHSNTTPSGFRSLNGIIKQ
jgi:hypothetical protein